MYGLTIDTMVDMDDFSGKMSRADYWKYFLYSYAWILISAIFFGLISIITLPGVINGMFPLIFCLEISRLAANARRLHDVGKSGWWQLLPIYSLYLYVQPSVPIYKS